MKKKNISKDKWVWMPHPAHFICSYDCKFFLSTRVGKYIVSTVGEYFPDEGIREIYAKSRKVKLEGMGDARRADYMRKIGYEDIGLERKYETMVFDCEKRVHDNKCCPFKAVHGEGNPKDFVGYNSAEAAYKGHMKLCSKWSKKQ